MKLFPTYVIVILISFLRPVYSQQIKVGVFYEIFSNFSETYVKYNFTQTGDIDKSKKIIEENDFGNFNSFGVSTTTILFQNFLTGLEISYGEKYTWDITFPDNYYAKTNISLLTLNIPFLYIHNLNDDYFLEAGFVIGYTKGTYTEEYNLRNPNTGILEDKTEKKNEFSVQLKPQLKIGTKLFYPLEPELFLSYSLTSKFNYEDFRVKYIESVEYNFNYLSIGLTLNYAFNL